MPNRLGGMRATAATATMSRSPIGVSASPLQKPRGAATAGEGAHDGSHDGVRNGATHGHGGGMGIGSAFSQVPREITIGLRTRSSTNESFF